MNSREEFEKLAGSKGWRIEHSVVLPDEYEYQTTNIGWESYQAGWDAAWQRAAMAIAERPSPTFSAGQAEMRERCAFVADYVKTGDGMAIADAIRALPLASDDASPRAETVGE